MHRPRRGAKLSIAIATGDEVIEDLEDSPAAPASGMSLPAYHRPDDARLDTGLYRRDSKKNDERQHGQAGLARCHRVLYAEGEIRGRATGRAQPLGDANSPATRPAPDDDIKAVVLRGNSPGEAHGL